MFFVAMAFIAGGISVAADRTWGSSQFTAGILYTIGGLILVVVVPALHATGTTKHVGYALWQPFSGGAAFVVLQGLSWFFYSASIVALIGTLYWGERTVGLLSSSGIFGILSQVLMASSLHTFVTPVSKRDKKPVSNYSVSSLHESFNSPLDDDVPLLTRENTTFLKSAGDGEKMDNFAELLTTNLLLILVMVGLSLSVEWVTDNIMLPAVLSLIITPVALFLTHGIGGRILGLRGWSFWQPFTGGSQFIVLQAVTWMLFSVSLICQLFFIYGLIYWGMQFTYRLMQIGGVTALASEILCMVSFRFFKAKPVKRLDPRTDMNLVTLPRQGIFQTIYVILLWNLQFVPFMVNVLVVAFPAMFPESIGSVLEEYTGGLWYTGEAWGEVFGTCMLPMLSIVLWVITFSIMSTLRVAKPILYICSPPWIPAYGLLTAKASKAFPLLCLTSAGWMVYGLTYFGDPDKGVKNRRDDHWNKTTNIWDTLKSYFGGAILVSEELKKQLEDGEGPGDKSKQHMVGFHPHGIMPSAMVWGVRCTEWREKFPNFELTALTASIMHYVPLMRDILHWSGVREVSKPTLLRTIAEGSNPCIVIGGQSEMFMSRSRDTRIAVVTFHNGFFKIAQEKQLPIVPMFSFGETKIYDNIELPAIQKWFKDRLGFPIPFVPMGRWNLPIPRRRNVILAVGAPVHPLSKGSSEAEIEAYKNHYYTKVEELFEEFKHRCGYSDHTVYFVRNREDMARF
eukprot:TRINITY_DN20331_c0_g1_i1.p1 TRINITY_DN20331_c0_g1~~TRINITY_DN20331_c0_g1_i1.p1  ORF type:complete len:811 (+),score=77.86 TRINITY_DN20331_c0_g1_i1:223-2433(+)